MGNGQTNRYLWEEAVLTESVGDPRLHAVGQNVGNPVFVLRLDEDHDAAAPQSVDRHLRGEGGVSALLMSVLCRGAPPTHLLEADVCDALQDVLHRVGPLPLAQRILLRPDHVEVMRDVVGAVVSRLPLAFALKPRFKVVGGGSVPCGSTITS